ncbi:SDR family oxidoreductase [Anaerolineae bacterium CFX9]|nr:SDR family oxidoreductase [Anaerolineae bacterium CFX9]
MFPVSPDMFQSGEIGMLLEGKLALITGAGSGIGRAASLLFAQHGAQIAVIDIDEPSGEETARLIRQSGGEAIFFSTDVGNMTSVRDTVERVIDRFGRVNILFSNAAAYTEKNAIELTEAEWDRTLAVCLKATWMLAHFTVPSMLEHGGGTVVITGSVHAIRGYANYTPYQAAKGGLLALTRSLAADFAPSVRVNTILPGAVVTGLWKGLDETQRTEIAQMCPLKRNGTPEEIANVALFLASDMSSYITGTQIVVDGGLSSIIQL